MPKKSKFRTKIPAYRQRKDYNHALVTLTDSVTRQRRDYWLGAHGSPESREAYHRVIAAWEANGRRFPAVEVNAGLPNTTDGPTITEVVRDYWRWAEGYYRPKHMQSLVGALRLLKQYFGHAGAIEFGPNNLRLLRDEMIRGDAAANPPRMPWSRKYINSQMQRIRHVFKWAAARELVPASVHQALCTLEPLAEPELASRSKVYTNAIVVESTGSVLKVISAEAYSKHGINAHGIIVDELHAQPDRELVDVLMTSTGARRQPLVIYITTADFDRPSICNEKYDYATKVRDGIIEDPAFLPVIYEAKQDYDWTDPDVWARANPNLGISVSMEYLERECRRARETPSYENTFKRLHLNMKTQQDVRWLSMEAWDACGKLKFEESSLEGERCFAGLDLSTTTDISAFVMVFPREDGQVAIIPRFWIPAESAEKRERRDRVPYTTWARQGFIEMTSGNVVDYDTIRTRINELKERFNIAEIAIDPWNATQLSVQLQGDGFEVVTFGQGFKDMTAPSKELEKLVMSNKLMHSGHPVLRWMASNVAVETDAAGNLKPSKKKSTERIDGIVAAVMGLGRALQDEGESDPGVFLVSW